MYYISVDVLVNLLLMYLDFLVSNELTKQWSGKCELLINWFFSECSLQDS